MLTPEQVGQAIGERFQVHTVSIDPKGHLVVSTMARDVFMTLIRMPTCKLSHAEERMEALQYALRVETSQRTFYVHCPNPISQ